LNPKSLLVGNAVLESKAWSGKLSDTALLPVSEQIIDEHRGESDGERDVRISWDSTVKRANAGFNS